MADDRLTESQMNQVLDDLFSEKHPDIMKAKKYATGALKERITNAARNHVEGCSCISGRDIFRLASWNRFIHLLSPDGFGVPKGTKSSGGGYFCKCQVILSRRSSARKPNSSKGAVSKDSATADLDRLRVLLDQARKCLINSEYEKAISIYHQAISIDDRNVQALVGLSECMYEIDEFAECASYLSTLLQVDSSNSEIYFKRARCYDKVNKIHQSLKDMTIYLDVNPNEEAYEFRATLQYRLRKYHLALKDYEKAFELAPDKTDRLQYMAYTCRAMGKIEEAEYYEKQYRELSR